MAAVDLDKVELALKDGRIINPATIRDIIEGTRATLERNKIIEERCKKLNDQVRAMAEGQNKTPEQKAETRKAMIQAITTCCNELAVLEPMDQVRAMNAVGIMLGFKPE